MNIASGILFATLSLAALTGFSQTGVTSPDMKETKRYKPADSVRNYNGGYNKLFAFVGEMITVDQLPYQPGDFDESFKAKYRILQKVYGKFEGDTIEFLVFDHYGRPPFTRYKNVLLYVFADSGTYVHEKYMYNHVYKTKDQKWAGPYDTRDYAHELNKHTTVKPVKLDFSEEVAIPLKGKLTKEEWKVYFPAPYYKLEAGKAIVVYGNYVEDLVKLKQGGFLKAREQHK